MAFILVVDDSAFQRAMVRGTLEQTGHEIVEARNGREALALIAEREPDCVITDLIMPEVGGIELLKEIKNANLRTPVLVLTSDIQTPVSQECRQLGANAFLNKPLNRNELRDSVRKVLADRKEVTR